MADTSFTQALDSFRESQKKERIKEARELEKTKDDETKKLEEINEELKKANGLKKRELERDKAGIEEVRAD